MLFRFYITCVLACSLFDCMTIGKYMEQKSKKDGVASKKNCSLKVEISVIIDYSLYQKWFYLHNNHSRAATTMLTNYYTNLFTLLETRMRILSFEAVAIRSKLVDLTISTRPDEVPYIELKSGLKLGGGRLDGEAVITEYWHSVGVKPNTSDLTIIFTNYELENSNGMSFERSVCERNAVSLVRENSTLNLLNTLSHEISHILGSGHDGEGNNCESGDQYLMAPFRYLPSNPSHALNYLHLSPCSRRSIVELLGELERNRRNCLEKTKRNTK